MEIRQMLVESRAKTYAGTNPTDFITIHETANRSIGAGALSHAKLQAKGNVRDASWHWQVDDALAIQSFPNSVRCWHAGDGRGPGNLRSIAIEICVNADIDQMQAYRNAAELVRMLMAQEGVPLSNVVQHNRWSGKNCPTLLRGGLLGWGAFLELCASGSVPTPPAAPPTNPASPSKGTDVMSKLPNLDWRTQRTSYDAMDERVQALLKADDNYSGALDGRRGPISVAGMRSFQAEHRCGGAAGPDLLVGPKTWESLLTGRVW